MKKLNARAWLALAILAVVMGLLLFVAAGTVRYWQAWVYLLIFTGASVLTTLYLMRKDPALLERRLSGGPAAEKQRAQKFIMLCISIGFIALLVVPALDHRFGWSSVPRRGGRRRARCDWILSQLPRLSREHFRFGNHPGRRESEGVFDRPIRDRSPSDVRE
jgi:hypothetical protein